MAQLRHLQYSELGSLQEYVLSASLPPLLTTTDLACTVPLGIQILPAVILAALILFFPESPRWLIDHGRGELGLQTLAKLHSNGNIEDPWVKAEFSQIEEAIGFDREHEAKSYMELIRTR